MGLGARLQQAAEAKGAARKKEAATLLGETIEVRSLMVGEKHRLIDEAFNQKGGKLEPVLAKLVPALLHKCVYDPRTGLPAFGSVTVAAAFVDSIPDGEAEADEVQKVVDVAMRLSGLNKAAGREAAKNSKASDA